MTVPRVDFYLLDETSAEARLRLACRLADRAYGESHQVFMLASGAEEARLIDDLLWTFRDRSFVPHDLVENAGTPPAAVLIGTSLAQSPSADVLINLGPILPEGCERFARIIEPLDADEERKKLGRERFKGYRGRGMPLETHKLSTHSGNEP